MLKKHQVRILRLSVSSNTTVEEKPSKLEVFTEQIIDSAIVGGISGISSLIAAGADASLKVALLAFMLTFLYKLKEYRKL
ncbi:hypothetical protein MUP46_01150 [Patescibacteria group bacterium]|nr:hypothetical protein [Patescibacteria group bacterium]